MEFNSNGAPCNGEDPFSSSSGVNVGEPVWVKLVRNGNQFSGYYSTDNVTWIQVGTTQTIAMGETIRGGLAVTAGDNGCTASAAFRNISITESRNGGEAVAFQQSVSQVDFDWGDEGSPGPGIDGIDWSATWEGKILADYTGTYTFFLGGDDGTRLWINGVLQSNSWYNQGFNYDDPNHYSTINLTAGQWYSIRIDYYQAHYGEAVELWWAPPGQELGNCSCQPRQLRQCSAN